MVTIFLSLQFQIEDIHELSALKGLSARERNRAKRKAKMASRKSEKEKANERCSEIKVNLLM